MSCLLFSAFKVKHSRWDDRIGHCFVQCRVCSPCRRRLMLSHLMWWRYGSQATWLILPVVICLSQRLSHACLSVNKSTLWNCEWLIKSVIVYLMISYYLDNRSNSRANTCTQSWLLEGMYLLDTKPMRFGGDWWFIITLRIAWSCTGDESFKFLPYQLSMVG